MKKLKRFIKLHKAEIEFSFLIIAFVFLFVSIIHLIKSFIDA